MAENDHEMLEQLFSAALEKGSTAERNAFLDGACGSDTALRSHVQELLKVHDKVGSFMDSPPVDTDATIEAPTHQVSAGKKIGRYKILEEIGEGGFGVVYLAEQEVPVRRMVALKIIKLGMDTKQVIARFEAERQALALMDHRNIAKVLDAGSTETGRPYFVMELVKGVTISHYCNEHKLTTKERLELMIPVCHAIQHAHQKGIIHRDLKPNNVLVTLQDGDPTPKVIDFGIAKATTQRLTEKTLFTGFRDFVGTPEYMSPDQADSSGLDVDTRTDIYSLGVMLYELLTGATPFTAKTMRNLPFDEIRRMVREDEPPIPSVRLQTICGSKEGTEVGKLRQIDVSALPKLLRGDLDWIVMKALEKDRTRRYATAKDLSEDIVRHLNDEPVLAGPPRLTYRMRKFVRRNRAAVFAGTFVGIAIIAGLSLAMVGFVQATRSRDVAEKARAVAQEQSLLAVASANEAKTQAVRSAILSQFLQNMLKSVDPSSALGREVSVRYLLDEAARDMEAGALDEQPEVEATVRLTFGETYKALGQYAAAEFQLRKAQTLFAGAYGEEHEDLLRTNRALAGVLRLLGMSAESETLLRGTVDLQRKVLGEEHTDTLASMNELALSLWGPGRFAEAESLHRQTLEIQRRVLGATHRDTLESLGNLGMVCRALGRNGEADTLLRQALSSCKATLGEEHPLTSSAMTNLALLLEDQKELSQAQALFERSYELDTMILGEDHPRTLVTMNNLLRILNNQGKVEETRPLVAQRLDHLKRAADQEHADALTLHAYAWELINCDIEELRDAGKALPYAQRAVAMDEDQDAALLATLAVAYKRTGDLDKAIATQRLVLARASQDSSANVDEMQSRLLRYLLAKGDMVGAAATVSWDQLASQLGDTLIPGSIPGENLVQQSEDLISSGRFREAAQVLRGCLALRQKELADGHWLIAETRSLIGNALARAGEFADGESMLLEGYYLLKTNRGASSDNRRSAIRRIINLYELWKKPEKVAEWQARLESVATSADPGSDG